MLDVVKRLGAVPRGSIPRASDKGDKEKTPASGKDGASRATPQKDAKAVVLSWRGASRAAISTRPRLVTIIHPFMAAARWWKLSFPDRADHTLYSQSQRENFTATKRSEHQPLVAGRKISSPDCNASSRPTRAQHGPLLVLLRAYAIRRQLAQDQTYVLHQVSFLGRSRRVLNGFALLEQVYRPKTRKARPNQSLSSASIVLLRACRASLYVTV